MKDYKVTKSTACGVNDYLKVYLLDEEYLEDIKKTLSTLKTVKKVNITQQKSGKKDLTVYPNDAASIDRALSDVNELLKSYEPREKYDPVILTDVISSSISERGYKDILSLIIAFGRNMEKTPKVYSKLGEEELRNLFTTHLNAVSRTTVTTGETYNYYGKTDILVQDTQGKNLFIGECKIWKGVEAFKNAINQLLDNYVADRDEKVALIIFNQTVQGFDDIREKIDMAIKSHQNYISVDYQVEDETVYLFKHPQNNSKTINIAVLSFNFN